MKKSIQKLLAVPAEKLIGKDSKQAFQFLKDEIFGDEVTAASFDCGRPYIILKDDGEIRIREEEKNRTCVFGKEGFVLEESFLDYMGRPEHLHVGFGEVEYKESHPRKFLHDDYIVREKKEKGGVTCYYRAEYKKDTRLVDRHGRGRAVKKGVYIWETFFPYSDWGDSRYGGHFE